MTADVFALLVQEGKLDPDAPIERYVPSLPAHLRKITARQLAGHLSGIRHYAGNEFYSNVHYPSVTAGLAVFENDPLLFEPGTKYSYTTYGYSLLSAVLEGASGEAFRTLIRHLVFEPLHLRNTTLDDGRVPAFEADANGFHVAPHVDNSYKWAGGGVISTAEDVVKFGSAHLAPGRLTPASLDLLFTSMKTADGKPTDYGAGWNVHVNSRGDRVVSHFGSAVGGVSRLMVDRDTHVVAALITDVTDTDVIRKALSVTWPEVVSAFDQ